MIPSFGVTGILKSSSSVRACRPNQRGLLVMTTFSIETEVVTRQRDALSRKRAADHQDKHQRTACSGEEVIHLPEVCSLTGRVGRVTELRKRSGKRNAAP
jgi:hypothetical protein